MKTRSRWLKAALLALPILLLLALRWEVVRWRPRVLINVAGGEWGVLSLAFTRAGSRLVVGDDHKVAVWDVATARRISVVAHPASFLASGRVYVSAHGGVAAAVVDGKDTHRQAIWVWSVPQRKLLSLLQLPPQHLNVGDNVRVMNNGTYDVVSISPDGKLLAAVVVFCQHENKGGECTSHIVIWNLASCKMVRCVPCHNCGELVFASNSGRLVFCEVDYVGEPSEVNIGEKFLVTYDIANRKLKRQGINKYMDCLAILPDNEAVVGFYHGSRASQGVVVQNLVTKQQLMSTRWLQGDSWSIVPSPDGSRLFAAGSDGIRCYDTATGRLLRTFYRQPHPAQPDSITLAISPDGSTLAAGVGHNVMLWRL